MPCHLITGALTLNRIYSLNFTWAPIRIMIVEAKVLRAGWDLTLIHFRWGECVDESFLFVKAPLLIGPSKLSCFTMLQCDLTSNVRQWHAIFIFSRHGRHGYTHYHVRVIFSLDYTENKSHRCEKHWCWLVMNSPVISSFWQLLIVDRFGYWLHKTLIHFRAELIYYVLWRARLTLPQ